MRKVLILATLAAAATPTFAQEHGSKEPPAGAPWSTDFAAARAHALELGKPLFLYSTKTY